MTALGGIFFQRCNDLGNAATFGPREKTTGYPHTKSADGGGNKYGQPEMRLLHGSEHFKTEIDQPCIQHRN